MTTAATPHSTGPGSRLIRSIRLLGLVVLAALFAAGCASSTTTTLTETASSNQTTATTEAPSTEADEPEPETVDGEPTAVPAQATAAPEPVETDSAETDPDDVEPTETETETASSASSVFDDGDFCAIARDLEENDPFSGEVDGQEFDVFSEDFFSYVVDLYDGLVAIAPDEIVGDIALIRSSMVELEAVAEQFDYNFFDPGMADAFEALDSVEFNTASDNIETYLADTCGIETGLGGDTTSEAVPDLDDIGGSVEDEDLAFLNQVLLSQFNLDPELEACLLEAIPNLTEAVTDPTFMQQEVCGTTLFNVFQGLG